MHSNPQRLKSVALRPKPRCVAMKRRTVESLIRMHKRKVRHAAKQFLKTRSRRDWNRSGRILTRWDFD